MTKTIPASELTPGMTIVGCETQPDLVGWKVTEIETADRGLIDTWEEESVSTEETPLLTLERTTSNTDWHPVHRAHLPHYTEQRSAWLRADDQVEVET